MTESHLIWGPQAKEMVLIGACGGHGALLRASTLPQDKFSELSPPPRRGWKASKPNERVAQSRVFVLWEAEAKTTSNRQIKGGEHVSNTMQEIKSTAARGWPIEERVSVSTHLKIPGIVNTSNVPTIITSSSSPYPRIVSTVARHLALCTHVLI